MKAEIIHVTDHAILRWSQRVSNACHFTVHDIIRDLLQARIISRDELLPFNTTRQPNTVYAFHQDVLFVCEPMEIGIYRLITVITYTENHIVKIKKIPKQRLERQLVKEESEPTNKPVHRKPKARVKRVCLDEFDF